MKIFKSILILAGIFSVFVQVNASDLDHVDISEQQTYQDFRENFQYGLDLILTERISLASGDAESSDTYLYWRCVINHKLIQMLKNNEKHKDEFNQELLKEQSSYDALLTKIQNFEQEQKASCEAVQVEYDKI
ncbi:hypothetical protein [Acinetobacter wuhouensis]|uniref:Uncharacterized protein n=1 Tax=Acinetobacter wuhouensis TaxID=1879050 RepID=A0A4Q7AHX8_9GAMM|nr:hypothetical protein [Acinetobacter wuhouensis]RZG47716.1 hypothetical protein EXU28_05120 [Acinetobacter wuhouensis]RZG74266.1 hypothetical protein EXU29_05250 [Acinetobacter wuhouensis]